jgi:hypothetical protein
MKNENAERREQPQRVNLSDALLQGRPPLIREGPELNVTLPDW